MRTADAQAPGLFLIEIRGQLPPDLFGWILRREAGKKDRKISDVDCIFLLKMSA